MIKDLLEREDIPYEILEHNISYTALETAHAQHIPGRRVIKSVVIQADDHFVMCVLPATHLVDLEKLKRNLNAQQIRLATEAETLKLFPDFEIGAIPPFGHLARLKVYVDSRLEENDTVAFNAGTHTEMIRIKFKDLTKIIQPVFGEFGRHI